MSLRFMIGRAGTGKTHRCLTEIADRQKNDPQGPLIYLVPEQATFHTEKTLLKYCGMDGTIHTQVLSFQRLAWRVLQETGGGTDPVINEIGKTMILRRLLDQHKKDIRAFARVMDKPGFLEDLLRSIAEFKIYNVTPESLADCLQELPETQPDNFQAKLEDLALLYGRFEAYLAGQYLDTEDYLHKLAQNIASAGFLKQAEIWLDGFYGFTPKEYEIIREILLNVPRVYVTLCLDHSHLKKRLVETDLFYQPWETYQRLMAIAQEIRCPLEKTVCLDYGEKNRFSLKKELAFLEESFVSKNSICQEDVNSVKLVAAANRRAELEGTARQMLELCREKGFRFQDMAVLIRDFQHYESLLVTVFSDYGIPYFLDKKRQLRHHPLLDLLCGALEVLEKGWSYEPVFRYLKTDLVPLSRQEVDLLENYCLSHGIRGSRWTDETPWTYIRRYTLGEEAGELEALSLEEEAKLQRINRARQKAVNALSRLQGVLREAVNVRHYAAAFYGLLEELTVDRKLESWSNKAEQEGRLEEARLHSQVWHKILELLDQMVEVLGEQEIKLSEFSRLLNTGLESIELGLIPPGLDQVLVGSVDRSRNPNMKAVFVLGVNEGVLPARIKEEGLISDEEKKILAQMQIKLSPTSEQTLYYEQYLVYLAMTRASDFLWVSFPQADEEGKALSPSNLIRYLESIFPNTDGRERLQFYPLEPAGENEEEFIAHPLPGLGYLAGNLRQAVDGKPVDPLWWEIYNWYLEQEKWRPELEKVVKGLFATNQEENITPRQIRALYGSQLQTSISRLEKFKACPFSHFLNYGLKLKEREEYKLKAPDLGQFFHAALESVYFSLKEKNLSLKDLTDKEIMEEVEETVDRLTPQLQNELLLSTSRYRYLTRKLKRTVMRAVRTLREHEQRSTFRPVGLEISFGLQGKLPGLRFELADGSVILLRGRIDRVDAARGEEGYYLRVIDYKSGTPSLSLLEIYYGLKLQLLAYLNVVLTYASRLVQGEAKPGGVFYFKIQDPFVLGQGPLEADEIEKRIRRELKLKGYLLKDKQAVMLMDKEISGYSDLIPAAVKADGEFYQNTENLLSLEEFDRLRLHVEKVFKEIGEEIVAGNVAIQPYRYKGKSPCSYCSYQAVCGFEPGMPGHQYRVLPDKEQSEVWNEIGVRGEAPHE